ncbi:MAG: hypothetical protein HOE48_18745 [Candidatus Latescibacteria bacterium]|nr:hypothetical protein [Candidatus Latescibacterota bacterium]MBT5832033.1 hypothetical protein [Candidatus Latescibacterota bacterium]
MLSKEPPKSIANILSHLDTPQSILIFNCLPSNLQKQVATQINQTHPSEITIRKLDQQLANKITKAS